MASVNSASSGYTAEFLASANVKTAGDKSQIELSQERFLKLLTTQMKNQDPLNPMDNAQMTSQMAQISTVTGIDKLNATLERLMSSSSQSQVIQASAMLGRSVLVDGSGISLPAEGNAIGGVELSEAADSVKITVTDTNGLHMTRVDMGALKSGVHGFAWDGKTDTGTQAAAGQYKFTVEATRGGEKLKSVALQTAEVTGVVRESTGISLEVRQPASGSGLVALDKVRQVF